MCELDGTRTRKSGRTAVYKTDADTSFATSPRIASQKRAKKNTLHVQCAEGEKELDDSFLMEVGIPSVSAKKIILLSTAGLESASAHPRRTAHEGGFSFS